MGSRTIQVLKRDGAAEEFDALKLAAALWRAMGCRGDSYHKALQLGGAVEFYLSRWNPCVSSAAIFEMCVNLLARVDEAAAAAMLQAHWSWREGRRRDLRIRHADGKVTLWDKSWLADFARRSWHLSPRAARILAAQVESQLIQAPDQPRQIAREEIIDRLNELVVAYGLADAVPVGR